jgi:predicted amidohydrolase
MAEFTVAAVQATPVFLDRDATVKRCGELIAEAAALGAGVVVFGETFVPGYPDWVWRTKPWDATATACYARLYHESVRVPGPDTERLGDAARDAGAFVAVGVNERDGSTLYNTLLYFGSDGALLGRHRKLVPTAASGWCGAPATAPRSPWSTPRTAGSAG